MDAAEKITEYVNSFNDWRGKRLDELRRMINESAPELTEDFKWSVPVWTRNGLVCAISAFKDHVKINFFKGAYLFDPNKLFNSGLDSKEHRSINFARSDKLNKPAITDLVRASLSLNNPNQSR